MRAQVAHLHPGRILRRVAVCCGVLLGVAVCCGVLQCVSRPSKSQGALLVALLSVLQCAAVCCSVLQRSVLQCIAVCCSLCVIHLKNPFSVLSEAAHESCVVPTKRKSRYGVALVGRID